jgi:hypothetical protein
MPTPALPDPDARGKRWLETQVQQILADAAVPLAVPRPEGAASCSWGTDRDTTTTLYLHLAGDPEPKALPFGRRMITDCGAGLYFSHGQARVHIRRLLKKMGIVSA